MSEEAGLILGIESSCDDTAVAIVDRAGKVISSAVATQAEIHRPFGGVYPEFASRAHIRSIIPAIRTALEDGNVGPADLRAIGVTRGPGLIGPLLVGLNTAAGLGLGWGLQVVGVNHLRGHLRSADLDHPRVKFPAVVLLVSGGHTLLARLSNASSVEILGSSRDDSVGEAYDKVGRMLGLGYPAGAAVDRLAKEGTPAIPFPRPMIDEGFEFSFSGLKSAVARYLDQNASARSADVASSFVAACMDILLAKCRRALREWPSASLVVVGGVAASPQLREGTRTLCEEVGVELCLPPMRWSTDNGAMIALATWDYLSLADPPGTTPVPRLRMTDF